MSRRWVLITALLLTGCVHPYAKFYQPSNELVLSSVGIRRVQPAPANPDVLRGNSPRDDLAALQAEGWVVIGQSHFTGPKIDQDDALDQGRKVGADRVVMYGALSCIEHTVLPLKLPTTQTSVTNGTATAFGPGGTATAYGSATTTTYGTETTYIPLTINRYEALALYLVKERYSFGGTFCNLTCEEASRVGSVNGVALGVVVRGSPAAAAGFLQAICF